MTRLYSSADHERLWIAYTDAVGYVIFPAEEGGWFKRKPFHGLDPLSTREVPVQLASNTGFPVGNETRRNATAA